MINALAGADLYCIVDACSVDGWVFVEKVTWVNQSGDCWEFHCPNSQNGWDATLHWKVRQNGALTSILGSIISWHLFLSWLGSVEWRWSKKRADLFSHQYLFFFPSNCWVQFWILSFDKFSVLKPIPINGNAPKGCKKMIKKSNLLPFIFILAFQSLIHHALLKIALFSKEIKAFAFEILRL